MKNTHAWLVALGLIGMAIYQTSIGDYNHAVTSMLAALAALGLLHAAAAPGHE